VSRRHSEGVVWEAEALSREEREALLGKRGATVWFTGLPASGKSTVARNLVVALAERGIDAYRLDGDNLRHGLCGDLGFDHASREENIRRAAEVARLMADAGIVVVVSLVSPYRASRDMVRCLHADAGLPFLEVWVSTALEECERRDPKGLYARARRGELANMTGIDDPYEPPESPEIEVTEDMGCDAGVAAVLAALDERGVV
jgi:adenylyl-sulfate kinase